MRKFPALLVVLACAWLAPGSYAGQTDITFVVAGKTSNHRQQADGRVGVLNYHFFAEIFLQEGGQVTAATLFTPLSEGRASQFSDSGYALEYHGGRYASEAELERNYPDGNYVFNYTAPSTGQVSQMVRLSNPELGRSGLPAAPVIKLSQNGKTVEPAAVDPTMDLRVSWSPFTAGSADPLAIMDDLLFVIMGDCEGVRRAHSGRPYENTPYLTYADTHFDIRAEQLLAENVLPPLPSWTYRPRARRRRERPVPRFASLSIRARKYCRVHTLPG